MAAVATQVRTNPDTRCDLLCIDVGAERFAMPLSSIEEIVEGCGVERTADWSTRSRNMVGVLRLRNELVAAYEPASVLNVARTGPAPLALVLQGRAKLLLLLVDGAEAAPQVNLAEVRTPARLMAMDRVLDGVVFVHRRWVGLVNTAALIDALERESGEPFPEARHG